VKPKIKQHKKIAYILSQFPETHETFILREIIELEKNDIDLTLFSLKKCRDKIIHPQAQKFLLRTHYSSLFTTKTLFSVLYYIWNYPIRFIELCIHLIKYNYVSFEYLIKSFAILPISLHYARLIHSRGVQHIHAHWATIPTTSAIIISKILGIPFSFTAHAWDIFLKNPMLKEKVRLAEFVVTCTGYNKEYLDSLLHYHHDEKIIKNYHGIDFDTVPKVHKNTQENLIFSIGRLCEQKGFPYLIEAIAILKKWGHSFICKIVGEGPGRKALTEQIAELGLQAEVELCGIKPHSFIFDLFNQARMFVLPCVISRNGDRDGIPNVMIEALAMYTPVISTNVSGIPEIIKDGDTGITVEPRNSEKLAKAILYLYEHPELYRIITDNGRKLVEKEFDVKKNVKELVTIFFEKAHL